ncbi:hypothetical protein [Halobacteriovorax sp. HLS]|uniref:hypothetical protein n=1 Tax=Halobacteriovorax sp. HLS TaxID=2234000 RepID=UPI000FD88DFA|nr:hypothetical protein [Halobacteriovorax sp. HLS]
MKFLSFIALFSLFTTNSFACSTYEAQIIADVVRVETDSMMTCKAFISAESIQMYNEHGLCGLKLEEVLENGIDFPLINGHDCEVEDTISGYLYTTKTGISLD